jgi:DNA-binding CsgD family transcriptional regulator
MIIVTARLDLNERKIIRYNLGMTQEKAISILKTGANVFLTGEPGSGKTHTINTYVKYLREHDIEPAITASTGIAATHIGGMTIHSWSGIGIKTKLDKYELDRIASSEHVAKRIRRAKILIIDEISMLPPDTLSMVDAVCREVKQSEEAFGGLQLVLVGDFFQLPPIIKNDFRDAVDDDSQMDLISDSPKRFSYDSPAWARAKPLVCYLSEQYRQDDSDFLSILTAIRGNNFEEDHLIRITTRKVSPANAPKDIPKLFSHNVDVDIVNSKMLSSIDTEERSFEMSHQGKDSIVATLKRGCLSPETLFLKVGAKVMFTKNNLKEGFVNGTLGEVREFDEFDGMPIVKTRKGRSIKVTPLDWTVEEGGKIRARISQIPLRLAWAITVHKSQGMSLDEAVMDLSEVFEYGQGYVALSRVRRLTGLHILGWNERAFQVHPEVLDKDVVFHQLSDEAESSFGKIGEDELKKMHKNFIRALGGKFVGNVKKVSNYELEEKKDTYLETFNIIKSGKTVKETAKERGLTEGTIINHLEELLAKGKLQRESIAHLARGSEKEINLIKKELKKDKSGKLKPVFDALGGKYSYEQIRLVRLLLD